jgi:hypothetical protein
MAMALAVLAADHVVPQEAWPGHREHRCRPSPESIETPPVRAGRRYRSARRPPGARVHDKEVGGP